MPVPDFVPLIGSSFDQLGGQQLAWAQFSRGVEEANLARAQRAEEQQGNWMAQAAAFAQRRDELNTQRQLDADLYTRQTALQNQAEAERQKERAEDIANQKTQFASQIAYGKDALAQQQKIAEDKIAAATKNSDLMLDAQGQHLAANYLPAQKGHEQAQAALESLHQQIDETQSGLEAERGKKKPDANKIIDLNNRLKVYNGQLRQRESDAHAAERKLDQLTNRAENAGFEINDDGSITHSKSSKTWTWKQALKAAQENTTPLGPPVSAADTGLGPMAPPGYSFAGAAPSNSEPLYPGNERQAPWAGFTQGTGTTPPPEPIPSPQPANIPAAPVGGNWSGGAAVNALNPAAQAMRIGRYYTATPMDATQDQLQPQRARPVQVGRYTATPIEE